MLTSKRHRFGTDSLLLLSFCTPKKHWAAADLCAGCGILVFGLLDAGLQGEALAIELDEEAVALMEEAKALNGASRLQIICGDVRLHKQVKLCDLVVANPPYFNSGLRSPDAVRARARHDDECSLPDLCKAAGRMLKDGGRFCLCYPPTRLAALFSSLQEASLAPKRLCFVRKSAKDTPWLVLLDARKNGGVGLEVLPDRILPPGEPVLF